MVAFNDLHSLALWLLNGIGALAVEQPHPANALMLGLRDGAQAWLDEQTDEAPSRPAKATRIMLAEPPEAEDSPSPAADVARARWNVAICEAMAARVELYKADPRHACLMDINVMRLLAGAGEQKA